MGIMFPLQTSTKDYRMVDSAKALRELAPHLSELKSKYLVELFKSEKCVVGWKVLASIAFVESNLGKFKVNKKSQDFGIMQINRVNLKGISKVNATDNDKLSVQLACKLLKEYKTHTNDLRWIGAYNTGPKGRKSERARIYTSKIQKTLKRISHYEVQNSIR